jgi:DNA mismatch repair protein MSH4
MRTFVEKYEMQVDTKYDNSRRYYLRIRDIEFDGRPLPEVLINRFRKKGYIECQTLDLMKLNQRIQDSHQEVILMSDKTVEKLIEDIREDIPTLFRVCECIAKLDMLAAFAQVVIGHGYVRPEITDELVMRAARHPVGEKVERSLDSIFGSY